jgi:hypothetical protein
MEKLSITEIRAKYPDQWVLIGNPELDNNTILDSVANKLKSGVVILAGKDKRELAYQSVEFIKEFNDTACVYTGKIETNRRFLL